MKTIINLVIAISTGIMAFGQTHPYTTSGNSNAGILFSSFAVSDTVGTPRNLEIISAANNSILYSYSSTHTCAPTFPKWRCGTFAGLSKIKSSGGYTAFQNERPSGYGFLIFDDQLNLIDSTRVFMGTGPDGHDMIISNGKIYLLFLDYDSTINVTHMGLEVQDSATKAVVYSWSTKGSIPYTCGDTIYANTVPGDFFHFNSCEPFMWNGDEWNLISARKLGLILLNTTNNAVYQMGGNCSDYTMDFPFSGQHDARVLSADSAGLTISLFDNENGGFYGFASGGSVYRVDTASRTLQLLHRVIHPDSVFGGFMGSFEYYSWGSLIGWGGSKAPDAAITLFDSTGKVLWDLVFPDTAFNYRAILTNPEEIVGIIESKILPWATPGKLQYFYLDGREADPLNLPKGKILIRLRGDLFDGKVIIQD